MQRNTQLGWVVTLSDRPGVWLLPSRIGTAQQNLNGIMPYRGSVSYLDAVPAYIIKLAFEYCGYPIAASCYDTATA